VVTDFNSNGHEVSEMVLALKQESIYCIDLPLQTAQLVLVSTIYLFMSISRLEVNWRSSCCRLDCFDLVIVYPVSLQYTVWP
jgi:hypothetical protein